MHIYICIWYILCICTVSVILSDSNTAVLQIAALLPPHPVAAQNLAHARVELVTTATAFHIAPHVRMAVGWLHDSADAFFFLFQ